MNELAKPRFVLATTLLARMRGLLGTDASWGDDAHVLAILPCKSVHTFGMRYALDIAFCDRQGVVIRSEQNVLPGRLLSCKGAAFVLEKPHSSQGDWLKSGECAPVALRGPQPRSSTSAS